MKGFKNLVTKNHPLRAKILICILDSQSHENDFLCLKALFHTEFMTDAYKIKLNHRLKL